MLKETIILILLTFLPFLELRFSIPAGMLVGTVALPFGHSISGMGLPWYYVFIVCVVTNIILGAVIYQALDKLIHLFCRIKVIDRIYSKLVERAQRKIHRYVEKYGEIGVAVFIGIPLPGSGVYTGALGAYALGLKFKKFMIANVVGVLIAGTIVTITSIFFKNIL